MRRTRVSYTLAIRDTATHYLPNLADHGRASVPTRGAATIKIVNDLDQDITVNVRGSTLDDEGMLKDAPDISSIPIAAGGRQPVRTAEWSHVRISVAASVAPSAGEVEAVFQSEA